jgi:hypothetical protein
MARAIAATDDYIIKRWQRKKLMLLLRKTSGNPPSSCRTGRRA